jgi:hypothetical protein
MSTNVFEIWLCVLSASRDVSATKSIKNQALATVAI